MLDRWYSNRSAANASHETERDAATVEFECPYCGEPTSVAAEHTGQTVWCPKCKGAIQVSIAAAPDAELADSVPGAPTPVDEEATRSESILQPDAWSNLVSELEKQSQRIDQLTDELEEARRTAEHYKGVADGLKLQVTSLRVSTGTSGEQPEVAILAAQIQAQHMLIAEKEERIEQLTAALTEALHGQPAAGFRSTGPMQESVDAYRLSVALDEARYLGEQRGQEVEALRDALVDKAEKLERATADFQAAATRISELREENRRLSNELAAVREGLEKAQAEAEAQAQAQARTAALLAAAKERAPEPSPRPVWHTDFVETRVSDAPEPAKIREEFPGVENMNLEPKGEQREIVDSLLRFLKQR